MRDGDEFYLDVKQKSRDAEIKSESDLICSNLESSGSYKCIKCCKVNTITVICIVLKACCLTLQTCYKS